MIKLPKLGNSAHILNNTFGSTWNPQDRVIVLYSDDHCYFTFNGSTVYKYELVDTMSDPFYPFFGTIGKGWAMLQACHVKYVDNKWCCYQQDEIISGNLKITKNILYFPSLEALVLFLLV